MLHGAVENSRIFYSESGKGLGWFLARAGFDVYMADLAGRGLSSPPIDGSSLHSQSDSICHEIPALLEAIAQRRPAAPVFWLAHSWGGVLLAAVLARQPHYLAQLKGLVFFGSKRTVHGLNPEKLLKVYFFWNRAAFALTRWYGYLPAAALGVGSDSESLLSHRQCVDWVQQDDWRDSADGFDYQAALRDLPLPPTLHIMGASDCSLGHPDDVRRFQQELNSPAEFWLLSRRAGNLHDYDHINMLTHPDAVKDHFPRLLQWLQRHIALRPLS
ncbi:MAG: alpha/beta fold hydrolase [Candidatus Sericytochromatia bacterium]|nr:alpha/beta fold hydrolase [Candidatus Sericytochromatia bacterium]